MGQKCSKDIFTLDAGAAEGHPPLKRLTHRDRACHIDGWIYSILPTLPLPLPHRRLSRIDGVQHAYDNIDDAQELSKASPTRSKVASHCHDGHVCHAFRRSGPHQFQDMGFSRRHGDIILRQPCELWVEARIHENLATGRCLFPLSDNHGICC
jgi:hypothetical protein